MAEMVKMAEKAENGRKAVNEQKTENGQKALELKEIHKSFFENEVLSGVSFGIEKGEVLGLLGANGAGKSTLMKIVTGVYRLDSGQILVNGREAAIKSASDASASGIAMVYQEFSLIPTMTVSENLFLNREIKKNGMIDDAACRESAKQAFDEFGIAIDPQEAVENLSIGSQQLVEIVKALMQKPSVLILDEPTASLTNKEVTLLFSFIRKLKEQKIAVIFISHHMQEIMEICDRAVILRNGKVEMDRPTSELSVPVMVEAMIGKKLSNEYLKPQKEASFNQPVLRAQDIGWGEKVRHVSFELYAGEIVGIAGLLGSGRTELMKCLYGLAKPDSGTIWFGEKELPVGRPWDSIEGGMAYVPENRRRSGIVEIHSIKYNMLLSVWKRMKKGLFINEKNSADEAERMRRQLDVKCTGVEQEVRYLSGGNQQKVVFAKSLLTNPKVLLLDDPTVGIDVEAKAAIAQLIRQIADAGSAVLLVSSEMEDLERLCDRIFIMAGGELKKELSRRAGDPITESVLAEAVQEA